uniref:Uncharacterized protein n=1 Tax=Magallana gigas TaxID=29159 RepID=K1QLY3_MAGGI
MPYLRRILLLCLFSGVLGAVEQRCDLIGSLQCLRTFSSSHKFQVSSYAGDYDVNPGKLVTEMCTKLEHLYLCVGDRMLGCAPQYRLMYETAVSSGRFVCNDGKQGFIDNFRCLVSNSVKNSSISCGGKILAVIQKIFSSPASVLPDLASKADELCIKSNDTLKCVIERTTAECGAGAAAYVQRYMDTSISPLKSFFACTDNRKFQLYQIF